MKIVVAYSGGLDTSVILSWLKSTYSPEVIAFCADIGQEEELVGLEKKALKPEPANVTSTIFARNLRAISFFRCSKPRRFMNINITSSILPDP